MPSTQGFSGELLGEHPGFLFHGVYFGHWFQFHTHMSSHGIFFGTRMIFFLLLFLLLIAVLFALGLSAQLIPPPVPVLCVLSYKISFYSP